MRFIKQSMLALLAAFTLAVSVPATAQTVVLTVNIGWLMEESQLGQDIARQLQEYDSNIVGSLEQAGGAFQAEVQDLQRQREEFIITDEVYEQRVGELQLAERQLMARGEVGQQLRQYAVNMAPEVFFDAIQPDIEAVFEERGGQILLQRQSAIFSVDETDISETVLGRVEARITSLEVDFRPPQVRAAQEAAEE